MATVRVSGADLDPAGVTEILGMEPETAARQGGILRRLRDGRSVIAPTGTWFATSTGRVSGGPAEHFAWALGVIERGERRLRALAPDVQINLSLMLGGPEADVVKAFQGERSRLLPLLQQGSDLGRVTIDLPTVGEEYCFGQGDRITVRSLTLERPPKGFGTVEPMEP